MLNVFPAFESPLHASTQGCFRTANTALTVAHDAAASLLIVPLNALQS